jgi:cell division protein FtsB
MKILNITLSILFITFLFTACTSKTQTHVVDSNKDDISKLLKSLIEKEQEINKLNQKLEDCKEEEKTK